MANGFSECDRALEIRWCVRDDAAAAHARRRCTELGLSTDRGMRFEIEFIAKDGRYVIARQLEPGAWSLPAQLAGPAP